VLIGRDATPVPDETSTTSSVVYSGAGGLEGIYNQLYANLSDYMITGVKWNVVREFIYGGNMPLTNGCKTRFGYNSENRMTSSILYDSDGTTKIVEETMEYSVNRLTTVNVKIYDEAGTTAIVEYTDILSRVNNNLSYSTGDCESTTPWGYTNSTIVTDGTNKVQGTYGIKVTITTGTAVDGFAYNNLISILSPVKYYFISGWVKHGMGSGSSALRVTPNVSGATTRTSTTVTNTTQFENVGLVFNPSDWGTGSTQINLKLNVNGNGADYGYFDCVKIWEISATDAALTEGELLERYPNLTAPVYGSLYETKRVVTIS
jgi:hypothetical protein